MRGLRTLHEFPPVIVAFELWRAWRSSRQLCDWYRLTKREESQLSGRSLYIQIMRRRSSLSLEAAMELVNQAEDSYCEWPRKRSLRYRDLVSYIVTYDLIRDGSRGGVRADVARLVARVVPTNW